MVRKARKVVWTIESIADKKQIFSYWNSRNKSIIYSKKLNDLFNLKLNQVSQYPYIGRKTSLKNVRTIVIRDCLLIYEIFQDVILVSAVWEGHQNPENLQI